MRDGHGRTIDYLRISLTDRCNLRCIYCMPAEGIVQVPHDQIMRLSEIERLVRIAAQMGVERIRLTGGEPLVRRGVVDLVEAIASTPGIRDVSLTTNGILLPRYAAELKQAGLLRVNISLDTLDAGQYREITRGGDITSVWAGIESSLEAGFCPVKINVVAVRSLDQDFLGFAKLSLDRPLHVRFIEYMPVGDSSGICGCGWGPEEVVSCDQIRESIDLRACEEGLEPLVPAGGGPEGAGPARYYEFPGAQGTVGFISPLSRHFCAECNRIRLTSMGKIRPCLFSDDEVDIRDVLRFGSDDAVREVLDRVLRSKPAEHGNPDHARATNSNMNQIGG